MMTRSRRKRETLNKEDRLSSLPDALLTHILSFLSTKESFCTSVLSTRWKHLFASVPALSFKCCFARKTDERFVKFVNDILRVHNVLRVDSFRLLIDSNCLDSDLFTWICAAVSRNPRHIDFSARVTQPSFFHSPRKTCPLPLGLFTCQMLEHVSLVGDFVFGVIETVRLPNLKILYISNCKISDGDSASRLFASCPVLEDLTISSWDLSDIKVISICAPSLKSLKIHTDGCEWELNVPNLEYIHCQGSTAKWSSVTVLKSLRKADVSIEYYDSSDEDAIWELVNKFDEVQHLALLFFSMESLARDPFSLPMLNKLTTLELQVDSCEGWKFFRTLLKRSPNLECLKILENGFSDEYLEFPQINVLLPKRVPLCFSRSLKEVKICITEEDKVEDEWLKYLLKNAKVLEKLTVAVKPRPEEKENNLKCSKRELLIRKKLLAFPRGSKNLKLFLYVGYDCVF